MTINTTESSITISGDGSSTQFNFGFPAVNTGDISVYLTDSSGIETLLATTLYTLTLNAAPAGQIWGLGGQVVYPLSGPAVPSTSTITIVRALPLTQDIVLSNQGNLVPAAVEQGLDIVTMEVQQIEGQVGRQITVALSDPNPLPLPPVAQRAGLFMAFDSLGNPIAAASQTGSVPISSTMIPVVEASTTAIARTALGLGNVAVENIGVGLQDDGAGNLRVDFATAADSTDQSVTASFHNSQHFASGALTYTLAKSSTLFNGFIFYVDALTSVVTFAIDPADNFAGQGSGNSLVVVAGTRTSITTDGTGIWYVSQENIYGMNAPADMSINASVASNQLTISLTDWDGDGPNVSSPTITVFRDSTITSGSPVVRAVTGALSIVLPSAASLGATTLVKANLWVLMFDNAGTPVLGVINCSTPTAIYPINETTPQSPTLIGAGSTSAGAFYASSALTSKSFRILGYVEATWTSGTGWATAPSKIQLFGPGVKKPGEIVQTVWKKYGTAGSGANNYTPTTTLPTTSNTNLITSLAITPTSAVNLLRVRTRILVQPAIAAYVTLALMQDAGANAIAAMAGYQGAGAALPMSIDYIAVSETTSSTTFKVYTGANGNTIYWNVVPAGSTQIFTTATANSFLSIDEIMG